MKSAIGHRPTAYPFRTIPRLVGYGWWAIGVLTTQDDEDCRPEDGVIDCWDDRRSEQIANDMSLLPVYI